MMSSERWWWLLLLILVVLFIIVTWYWMRRRPTERPAEPRHEMGAPSHAEPTAHVQAGAEAGKGGVGTVSLPEPTTSPAVEAQAAPAPAVKLPEAVLPSLEAPTVEAPEVKLPQVEAPEVKLLHVEVPTAEAPEVRLPHVEAPTVEAPEVKLPEAELPKVDMPTAAAPEAVFPTKAPVDDLTLIEGIGPKIKSFFHQAGILTFAQLAAANVDTLREILVKAGIRIADPTTWPEQARLAAAGKMDELKALQEKLVRGRRA